MKQTFNWSTLYSHQTQAAPEVEQVTFGDGYEQARPKGLNPDLRTYSLTKNARRHEIDDVDAFLTEHGGFKSFYWYSPVRYKEVLVKCDGWSRTPPDTINGSISMTFREVVA